MNYPIWKRARPRNQASLFSIAASLVLGLPGLHADQVVTTAAGSGADSYVQGGVNANTNYNGDTSQQIAVDANANIDFARKAYARFDLSGIVGPVQDANLTFYVRVDNAVRVNVYGLNDGTTADGSSGWSETTLTWNNAPANNTSSNDGVTTGATLLGTFDMVDTSDNSSGPYVFSSAGLKDFVNADTNGLATVILTGGPSLGGDGGTFAGFRNKEYVPSGGTAGDQAPKLTLLPDPINITTATGSGADSYLRGGTFASSNFGSDGQLAVRKETNLEYVRKAYMRFDLSSVTQTVNAAHLSLEVDVDNSVRINVYGLNDGTTGDGSSGWSEAGVTWNNAPANDTASSDGLTADATLLGTFDLTDTTDNSSGPYIFSTEDHAPLLTFLNGDTNDFVTIILTGGASTGGDGGTFAGFRSKEFVPTGGSAGDAAPLLVILPDLAPTSVTAKTSDSGGADSYVRNGLYAGDNFGTATDLAIRAGSTDYSRKSYLRFSIPCLGSGSYQTASLKLWPANANAATINVYALNDGATGDSASGWSETGITWNNAPANDTASSSGVTADATLLGSFSQTQGNTNPISFSSAALLSFVDGDTNGRVTLILTGASGENIFNSFSSKEAGSTVTPTLELSYSGSAATCPGDTGSTCGDLPDPPGTTIIDLGEKGLDPGETIDSFLDTWLVSGNEVHVPAGTYRWNGGGFGTKNDCSLIGNGTVIFDTGGGHNWSVNIVVGSGEFELRNITVKGVAGSDDQKIRVYATNSSGKITLRNFNQPDGSVNGRRQGFFVNSLHAGEVYFIDCHIENFANNGIYASSPGQADGGQGKVHVLRGLYRNNNIGNVRIGSSGSSIVDVVSVQDSPAPLNATSNGTRNQRGLRVRYPGTGQNQFITNCDVTQTVSGSGAIVVEGHTGSSGVISQTRIRNDISNVAIKVDSGNSWSGDDVDITGTGNLNVSNISITNLCQGSGCEEPTTVQHPVCL